MQNRVVSWILRSQLSDILDRSVLLITVKGRKTGTPYTLPVQYATSQGAIWIMPGRPEHKSWWRNLRQESDVTMLLRGREVGGSARALQGATDPDSVTEGMRIFLRRWPSAARAVGMKGKDPDDETSLAAAAKDTVIVRVAVPPEDTPEPVHQEPDTGSVVKRHPLATFYALTFLLSWGYWIPDVLNGGHWSHFPGLLGPMIAAIITTGWVGGFAGLKDLVARIFRWRVSPHWYAAALAPAAFALVAAAIIGAINGDGFPAASEWGRFKGLPSSGIVAVFAMAFVINGFGEETGWRGFALPEWRKRHGELSASLLVAVPWALWHLPTFFLDSGYRGFPLLMFPGFFFGLFCGSIILTWLYEGARSSILLAALWHLSLNIGSATVAGEGALQAAMTMGVIVWAMAISRKWHLEMDRRRKAHT